MHATTPADARIELAADELARCRLEGRTFAGFSEELRPADTLAAYAIQAALHVRLAPALGAQAGWKIGCTTETMQRYLDIHEPSAGRIRSSTVHVSGAVVPFAGYRRPGVECELAVRLGEDLVAGDAGCDRETARAAVASVMAAIEIVDDRYSDWSSFGAPSLTADDFFGAGCVLGRADVPWRAIDLGRVSATMAVNGREIGAGVGADILGDPLAALVWLVEGPARATGLPAGSIVMLGSLVQTHWVEAGDVVSIANDAFGPVSLTFSA